MPDEPRGEEDEQRLTEWLIAPELVPEPGSDDPGEDAHRDGGRRPHPKDLGEGVLPYGCIPINCLLATRRRMPGLAGHVGLGHHPLLSR